MKKFQPTLEHAIYALALLIGLGLRFIHLQTLPLSDYEADWALQALKITQGLKPAIGPNPAYVHLTSILFSIFGATNFLARFWPALAGTALILAPWALRDRFGRIAAILLSFGLAVDPGLAAMSHLAGGPMLAISLVVFTAICWMNRRYALAGFLLGLALLSGPAFWFGVLGLALTWALSTTFVKRASTAAVEKEADAPAPSFFPPLSSTEFRAFLFWSLGTLLAVGTLLLLSTKGLSAFFLSFWTFLRGWGTLSGVPLWQPALALPAYEILPLGFGIAGAVRGFLKKDAASVLLALWALVALFLAFIYPAKQTGDLTWALLPLWALAALELSRHLDFEGRNLWEVAGTFTVVIVLFVFGWLNLASLTNMDLNGTIAHTRIWLLVAVFFLIILSLLLAATGWSVAVARLGGVWGTAVFLGLFTVAMSTGAAGVRQPLTIELWQPEPRTGRADIILKVADQISELNRGDPAQLPLTILSSDSASLHWVFRDWKVEDVTELAPDSTPEMIITPPGNVSLSVDYRGEPLVLEEAGDWSHATSGQWLNWFIYRQMPLQKQDIDLWVRSDLMLDNQGLPPATTNP